MRLFIIALLFAISYAQTECKDFCYRNEDKSWKQNCAWGDCKACPECNKCDGWCHVHSSSWEVKCNSFHKCFGCSKCNAFYYPPTMPPPDLFLPTILEILIPPVSEHETPIIAWMASRIDQANWNCIPKYHSAALDVVTKSRPTIVANEIRHNSEARALCMAYATNKIVAELLPGFIGFAEWMSIVDLNPEILPDEVVNELAQAGDDSPRILGSLSGIEIIADMQTDGWNYKGMNDCSANCVPFSDTTDYTPVNPPWSIQDSSRWQPLMETNNKGFFFSQSHITPHIGSEARPNIWTREEINARELAAPNYDFNAEVELVLERTRDLTEFQKAMIPFFDNKLAIFAALFQNLAPTLQLTLESQMLFLLGGTMSEVDSIIITWKEKVRHDLVRPTTRIHALGDQEVESAAGTHKAGDWAPHVRVMPHSEFPSGSACICKSLQEFTDAFVKQLSGSETVQITNEFLGFGVHTFASMSELRDACGDSRLWAGLHFTQAVVDGYALCEGLGGSAMNLLNTIVGDNGTFKDFVDSMRSE